MKNFLQEIKQFGLKVALSNVLIAFTKWFVGAKRIVLTFRKRGEKHA